MRYLKSIKLITSDYLLAFGFLFFIPFAAFSWIFMVTPNPSDVPFINTQMILTCFFISASCWGGYFYLESKAGRLKNNIFLWLFLFFLIMSAVSVLVQPTHSSSLVECKFIVPLNERLYPGIQIGDVIKIDHYLSPTHKLFFCMGSMLITTIFFIILFVLPKRITNINFLVLISWIVALFILVLTCYSFIVESDEYLPLIKALGSGDVAYIRYDSSINSFLVNKVPYGACLMMALLFMLLSHHLTGKKYWLIFGAYCYINMIFSWCKTSLLISSVVIVFYIVFCLIVSFKKHKIRNLVLSITFGVLLLSIVGIISASIISKGKFIYFIYGLYTSFSETPTILRRTLIWGNIRNELSGGWWIIGRGFGTHNVMLYPMNLVNGDDVCPSHSTYYGILGAGGIINMLGFAGIFAYFVYACIECFKVNKVKAIGLAFPVLAYFAYSFTECINYLWLAFMFPIILYYNVIKREQLKHIL